MLSNKKTKRYLRNLAKELHKKSNRRKIDLCSKWINTISPEPGVYAIFEKGVLVYVGETGNIQSRVWDMVDSRQHQLRRNVGRIIFSHLSGYKNADSSTKFPEKIEKRLNKWIKNKFKVSILPLDLGRKELEEYIFEKYSPKYNKKGRRKW